ncbi:MAG TPA: MFS transporter [Anaerolineae bacterium]|nr:MFS transporter [Anaerolineae bacterium]HCK66148.1 MFS transporter [Anaerolineae bacterium]
MNTNNLESIARKITGILFAQQSLASAGFIAAATLNSIVGKELSQNASWAGVPTAVYLLAGAFSAFMWGYVYDAIGRRKGLTTGLISGVIGSGVTFYAIAIHSFALFMVGMILTGIANAAVQLGRFAAAEVNKPEHRGRAISNVVIGGTVGSVIGPFVAGPAGNLVNTWEIDPLAGAYLIAAILFAIAAVVVFIGLRPDPREIGKEVAEKYPETIIRKAQASGALSSSKRSVFEILRQPAAMVAVISMVLGQMVMVLVMVITSLHMHDHQHGLTDISAVIASHTFGMFAFSIISGRLADSWGREKVILSGAITLVIACIAATISPDVLPLGVALFLLGLGWNFCFVGGSTLLADQLSPAERARTQGFNDLLVGLASAFGSLESGFIFASLGYNMMAYVSAGFALIPIIVVIVWMIRKSKLQIA